jgi:hypothetical protein
MTIPADVAPGAPPSAPRMRASDAQRDAVVRQLHDAVGLGLLTVDECSERTSAAYAAKHLDELPPLTADLPEPTPAAPTAQGWRSVGSAVALQARMTTLGAPTWGGADRRRRWLVLLAAVLLILLGVGLVIAGIIDEHHGREFFDHRGVDRD